MPYGISIKCLNNTALPIFDLWDEAGVFEPAASMRELNYPPHLTLAVFQRAPSHIFELFEEVFAYQTRLVISFEGVSYFENEFLVLWARPHQDDALFDLHARLHRHFPPSICHEHYRVDQWVPHCSLATKVPISKANAAIEWARQKRPHLSVEFDAADVVQFPPVTIERECKLG